MEKITITIDSTTQEIYVNFSKKLDKYINKLEDKIGFAFEECKVSFAMQIIASTCSKPSFSEGDTIFEIIDTKSSLKSEIKNIFSEDLSFSIFGGR